MLMYYQMKYLNVPLFLILFPIHLIAVIPIKVVIVSMFEYGADTGDAPGEFQFWLERNDVRKIEAPLGSRNYYLSDEGLLIMYCGRRYKCRNIGNSACSGFSI